MTFSFPHYFLLLLHVLHLTEINSITFTLIPTANGLYTIPLLIGHPEKQFTLLIDTVSPLTWLRTVPCQSNTIGCTINTAANAESISTYLHKIKIKNQHTSTTTIHHNFGSISGEIAVDDVKLGGTLQASKLELLIITNDNNNNNETTASSYANIQFDTNIAGVIGLDNTLSQQSVIYNLYQSKQINHNIFTLRLNNNNNSNTPLFSIGAIPNYILTDKPNYSTCKTRNKHWNCKLTHLLFGNDYNFYKAIAINDAIAVASFSSALPNIYVHLRYFNTFIEEYFEMYFNNNNCLIVKDIHINTTNVVCPKEDFPHDLHKACINFIFNGFAYKVPFVDLFEDADNTKYAAYKLFKVEFTDMLNDSEWVFGVVFMKQNEMVFDAETGVVGFYGGDKFDFVKYTNENIENVCLYNIFALVALVCAVVGPIAVNIWRKKKNNDYLTTLARKAYKRLQ